MSQWENQYSCLTHLHAPINTLLSCAVRNRTYFANWSYFRLFMCKQRDAKEATVKMDIKLFWVKELWWWLLVITFWLLKCKVYGNFPFFRYIGNVSSCKSVSICDYYTWSKNFFSRSFSNRIQLSWVFFKTFTFSIIHTEKSHASRK